MRCNWLRPQGRLRTLSIRAETGSKLIARDSTRDTEPLFVRVTVKDAPVLPTPVDGKLSDAGCIWTEPAAPPVPVNDAAAAVTKADELTVRAPVTTPFAVGVNTTPTEQPAPAARTSRRCSGRG